MQVVCLFPSEEEALDVFRFRGRFTRLHARGLVDLLRLLGRPNESHQLLLQLTHESLVE